MEPHQPSPSPATSEGQGASPSWFIGSGSECAFRVGTGPAQIALLQRRESRLFVRDLGSGQIVLVNQMPVARGGEAEVTRYDQLEVGGAVLEIEPWLFLGQAQLGINTTALYLPRPDGKPGWLCEGAFLRAPQGTFTAILGPAGCGKTVFLNLLNGYLRPSRGRVTVGQSYDLNEDSELLRSYMGFVPQDDVMVPELTVRQSLDFRLRLRFPDMAARVRARLIAHTCGRLGFHPSRLETFLDSVIGSPELGRRGLSGGERRRANIAHELVMKPAILLLDEPTSGLSSIDAEQVVGLLDSLAREEHLTVVATIHQPSRESFARFGDLMVLSHGGRLAYYGPANQAVSFFERATEEACAPVDNPAEYVLRHLHEPSESDRLVRYCAKQAGHFPSPLSEVPKPPMHRHGAPCGAVRVGHRCRFLDNFVTLLRRNLAVMRADRASLWLGLGQVPLMAMLIWLAFIHFPGDAADSEKFHRSLYHFSRNKEPYMKSGPMPVERLLEQAREQAGMERWMISPQMAQRRGALYFVLIAAAIWLGIVSGCREIVVEKHVLNREARTCIRIGPYLAAKLGAQILMTAVQCGMLTVMVVPCLLGVTPLKVAGVWLALWVTAAAAASLGLLISAMAPTYRAALTAVPLVLIPQLLFGGLLRPYPEMAPSTDVSRVLGSVTFQRWGFESALRMDPYMANGVMLQKFGPEPTGKSSALDFVRRLHFEDTSLASVFFPETPRGRSFFLPLVVLALEAGAFLLLGHSFLTRRLGLYRQR